MPIGIEMEWRRCPDGYEIHDYGGPDPEALADLIVETHEAEDWAANLIKMRQAERGGLWVRPKSGVTERVALSDMPDHLVLQFVNAKIPDELLAFFASWGLLGFRNEEELSEILETQERFRAAIDDPKMLKPRVEHLTSVWVALKPRAGATPTLSIRPGTLRDFMNLEILMLLSGGATIRSCQHCGILFAAGISGGKNRHATYCSPRCRYAASRAARAPRSGAPK